MDDNLYAQHGLPAWLGRARRRLFSRENLAAVALCLIVTALVIATADSAPQWIYQGF